MMNRLVSLFYFARLMLCASCLMPSARAATWYVATTGSDARTAGTQARPYQTIQYAVTYASLNDTISVANGTYTGAGNRSIDFGGVDLTVKSTSNNPAACVIDCQNQGRAFYLHNGESGKSAIMGFTITNGKDTDNNGGGGINISTTAATPPTVTNCVFTGNVASSGAGMAGGAAVNCVFTGNSATASYSLGGGMNGGTAANCVFTGNSAVYYGGGTNNCAAINCAFINNTSRYGGGMDGGPATNCVFTGNTASDSGGGIFQGAAINCVFAGNASGDGGGMFGNTATNCLFNGNSAGLGGGMYGGAVTNCVFNGNIAGGGGGIFGGAAINCVFNSNSATYIGGGAYDSDLYFCALANNTATASVGGVYLGEIIAHPRIVTNCIIWGNSVKGATDSIAGFGTVTYSDVPLGYTGTGNISRDPLFVKQATGNLHLKLGSPCINVGTTTVPSNPPSSTFPFPTTDLDGGKRTIGIKPDMGAYEYGNVGVSGTLTFDGIALKGFPQRVTFQFRPTGGGAAIAETYFTTSDGAFYLYGVPNGVYKMWAKSPTYLAAVASVTVASGAASGIKATLEPGDANNDNSVDSSDFAVLIGAFNTLAGDPYSGYDLTADFNGDGSVDSSDFALFISSFNHVGAP